MDGRQSDGREEKPEKKVKEKGIKIFGKSASKRKVNEGIENKC